MGSVKEARDQRYQILGSAVLVRWGWRQGPLTARGHGVDRRCDGDCGHRQVYLQHDQPAVQPDSVPVLLKLAMM